MSQVRSGSSAKQVQKELRRHADPRRAAFAPRFFKTGKGEYGEGDVFIGATVPSIRAVVKKHRDMPLAQALKLLRSPVHEDRLAAVLLLNELFKRGDDAARTKIYKAYLANTRFINNWDIIDSSAPYVVGQYLHGKSRAILYRLARSKSLWERRIAMLSTFTFIRAGEYRDALALAQSLLTDKHDLIHKAVGWMLREIGKQDLKPLKTFLNKNAHRMPRTMLRYAIEKFPKKERANYLARA